MRALALVLFAACSSKSAPDPCTQAFTHLEQANVFGGDDYGGEGALTLGMACQELTPDDLACLDKANSADDMRACAHVTEVAGEKEQQIAAGASDGPAPDPALVGKVADAFCACHDAACLVGVGETYRFELETLFASGASTDPQGIAAEKRLQECGDRLSGGKK